MQIWVGKSPLLTQEEARDRAGIDKSDRGANVRHNLLQLDGRSLKRFSETQADTHLVPLDEGRERNRAAAKRRRQPASIQSDHSK
jgi:hypothetical protein